MTAPRPFHFKGDGSMQRVVEGRTRTHVSFLMRTNPRSYFWELELACGHTVERRIRYLPTPPGQRVRRGWAAIHHGPGPSRIPEEPPKRARCTW